MHIEENPMLKVTIRALKFFSLVGRKDWRMYVFMASVCLMNAAQFVYLMSMRGDVVQFILNSFYALAIFDAVLRNVLIVWNREKFERFMQDLTDHYEAIMNGTDEHARSLLIVATDEAHRLSTINLCTAFVDVIGALCFPLFNKKRVHPIGVAIPFVDITATPVYEIIYFLQLGTPVVLTILYMPFINLFATFAKFSVVLLRSLQNKLKQIGRDDQTDDELHEELLVCIRYYSNICRYVHNFNSLVTYIVFVEFLLFGVNICSLLFCINIINSPTQIISIIMYNVTMFFIIFTYYWQANEIAVESYKVSVAACDVESWFTHNRRFKSTLLIFITYTQQPLNLMVGNLYPMTLQTFRSLLNTSYTYFTLLRGVYNQR